MTLSLDPNHTLYQIQAYAPGQIKINNRIVKTSIIISTTQLIETWEPQTFNELTAEHFAQILPLKPAILLIGTGPRLCFPALASYGELLNQKIGVEIMDTAAACRTFNVLTAENRNVIAALLLR